MRGPEARIDVQAEVKGAEKAFMETVSRFIVGRAEAGKLTAEDTWAFEASEEYARALYAMGRANLAQAVSVTVGMGIFREDENADLISCLAGKAS